MRTEKEDMAMFQGPNSWAHGGGGGFPDSPPGPSVGTGGPPAAPSLHWLLGSAAAAFVDSDAAYVDSDDVLLPDSVTPNSCPRQV